MGPLLIKTIYSLSFTPAKFFLRPPFHGVDEHFARNYPLVCPTSFRSPAIQGRHRRRRGRIRWASLGPHPFSQPRRRLPA